METVSGMIIELINDTKTVYTSGIATTGTGIGTCLDIIPPLVGVGAAIFGIVITYLIYKLQRTKLNLEIEINRETLRNKRKRRKGD